MKAYAYSRVSHPNQLEGDGLDRQEATIRKYAKSAGIQVVSVWREDISGTVEGMDRPKWAGLIGEIEAENRVISTILIEKLDRLARDLMVQEYIIKDLGERGITLVSAMEPDLCSADPTRVLMRQIMGAFSQYDKAMIKRRLSLARQRVKSKTGRCEGVKPYGHFPGEAEVITNVLYAYRDGFNYAQIARALNTNKVKPRSGKMWYPSSVRDVVKRAEKEA